MSVTGKPLPDMTPDNADLRDLVEDLPTGDALPQGGQIRLKDMLHPKAIDQILALIKLQQEALLAKLEAELPKEKAVVPYDPDVHLTEGHHTQIMAQIIAQNTTIDQVKTTIDKLRLEL